MSFIKKLETKILKSNFSWLTAQEIFLFIINYSLVIILAKLLSPESFGLVVLLNLYTGFFAVVINMGLNKIIIKNQIKNNIKLSALLSGIICFSILVFLLALIFLPLYLYLYFNVTTYYIALGLLSLTSIFTSVLYSFSVSLYIRDKKFKKMTKILIPSYLFSFLLVLVITYFNRSTSVLLYKQIIIAVIPITSLLYYSNFKFKIVFSKVILLNFFSFSKYISLNNVFNYFIRNIDYLILGHFFSTQIVGQYSIAYKVLLTPVKLIVKQVDQVSFPTIAKMTGDINKLKKYYLHNIGLIVQTLYPVIIAIIIFSDILVDVFFDSRYEYLSVIISILSISSLFQSVTALVGNMYIISDRTKIMFKLTILLVIIQSSILLVGAYTNNIIYFTIAYTFAYVFFNFPISNYTSLKPFNISVYELLKKIILPTIISFTILGFCLLITIEYDFNLPLKILSIIFSLTLIYSLINKNIQKLLGFNNVWYSRYL